MQNINIPNNTSARETTLIYYNQGLGHYAFAYSFRK